MSTQSPPAVSRFIAWILAHRALVLVGYLVITGGAMYTLSQATLGSSIGKLFFGDSPQFKRYLEYCADLSTDEQIIIGIEDVDIFSPQTLDKLEEAVAEIRAVAITETSSNKVAVVPPQTDEFFDGFDEGFDAGNQRKDGEQTIGVVRRVSSILSARRVRRTENGLTAHTYAHLARKHPERAPELRSELMNDPLTRGLLVSRNGRHIALVVELYPDPDRAAELLPEIVDAVEGAVLKAGFSKEKVHRAGLPALTAEMYHISLHNLSTLLPIVLLVLLITVFVMFRRLWPAFVAGLVTLIGVIWTMAIAVLIDREISVMHSIAPMVILIVGTSDVIHLISAYLLEIKDGLAKRDAILISAGEVGTACLYTSATTFVGFIALSFVPTPVFRQLGYILGAGVGFTLLIAVTLLPIILDLLPTPEDWRTSGQPKAQDILDQVLKWNDRVVRERPVVVLMAFAALLVASGVGLSQLSIETRITERMDASSPYSQNLKWFESHFSKANILQIVVDSGQTDGMLDPKLLKHIETVQAQVLTDPRVEAAFSVVDLIQKTDAQFNQDPGRVPSDRATIAQYALSLESVGRDAFVGLMDFERRRAMLSVRLKDEGMRATNQAGAEFSTALASGLKPGQTVEPTGMIFLTGDWLGSVLTGQRRGLLFTAIMVALMMIVSLRKVSAGLWSMLPNALPLLVTGGLLGLLYDQLDSDALVLAMLAIGIGVDDTIHFLMRYRMEAKKGLTPSEAITRTFHYAGRGIVVTTVVLTLGFLPMATSAYWPIAIYGTFLPLTLIFALAADLFLVPALAHLNLLTFTATEKS